MGQPGEVNLVLMALNTPVLLLVFNRPEHTQRVFQEIRKARPARLFVSADGPRAHVASDAENCRLTREIAGQVDWDCSVHTNFQNENLGCRLAVHGGISWFFEQVDAGIILEDDCLPEPAFFPFCTEMLNRYAGDERVMHVSGFNPAPELCRRLKSSYFFARIPFIWGWASWSRAWKYYDPAFTGLDDMWFDRSGGLFKFLRNRAARRYVWDKFARTRAGEINTWDFAWFFTLLKREGLSICPSSNLVRNIGFDGAATHTQSSALRHKQKTGNIPPGVWTHPAAVAPVPELDQGLFYGSQKSYLRLLLREMAAPYFYRPLPKRKH